MLDKLNQILQQKRDLEKEVDRLKQKLSSAASGDLLSQAKDIGGIKLLVSQIDGADADSLRAMVDQLKQKMDQGVVLLAGVDNNKIRLIAGVTQNCTDKIKAGDLLRFVAEQVGGKGGGRPDMAQGGGDDVAALPGALASVEDWVRNSI